VCFGELSHSATELARLLTCLKQEPLNSLLVPEINRRYLAFARLAATDALAGNLHMLLRLGITLEQAQLLQKLTGEDLDRLAFGWGGPIVRFAVQAFRRGVALHAQVGKQHAVASVATRVSAMSGEKS
jgi:hypothetical protein